MFYTYFFISLFPLSFRLLPLTALKLFMPMTCTVLKPIAAFQSSLYLTSQLHLIRLTIASSLTQFLYLVSRISHSFTHPTPVGVSPLLQLATSPLSFSSCWGSALHQILYRYSLSVTSPSPINPYIICIPATPKYASPAKAPRINFRLEPYKHLHLNVS